MNRVQLEALEAEIKTELEVRARAENSPCDPITDGVVDIDRYLASSPKILWILKEPFDDFENGIPKGGGWSATKDLIPKLIAENRVQGNPTYRKMAYVNYAVSHQFKPYQDIPYASQDIAARESLRCMAYINVSKMPGKTRSDIRTLTLAYQRNRNILSQQIAVTNPDVIIAGNILPLFFSEFGLSHADMQSAGTCDFCRRNNRLYINAYHPSFWRCKEERYVNDLVAVIKAHAPATTIETAHA